MKEITVEQLLWAMENRRNICKEQMKKSGKHCCHAAAVHALQANLVEDIKDDIAHFEKATGKKLEGDNLILAYIFEGIHIGHAVADAPDDGETWPN